MGELVIKNNYRKHLHILILNTLTEVFMFVITVLIEIIIIIRKMKSMRFLIALNITLCRLKYPE